MKKISSYIVFDSLTETFSPVFYSPNDRAAIKMFIQSVKSAKQSDPDDLMLYKLQDLQVPTIEDELSNKLLFTEIHVDSNLFED